MKLIEAIEKGDIEAVKQHLAEGADVNATGVGGWTPLHNAATDDRKVIVELLIANGADVNARNNFGTPLHRAAYNGHKETAELLITKGADVNAKNDDGETSLDKVISRYYHKRPEIADLLRKHGGKTKKELEAEESIHGAAYHGNIEAVKQHLAEGVDVNAKNNEGYSSLHIAAGEGHKEIVELLLDKGADVNVKGGFDEWTPLHNAANGLHSRVYPGHREIAELLIAKGADVNAKDDGGYTPLHSAALRGSKEIAELLIANGADVNAKWGLLGRESAANSIHESNKIIRI